MINLPKEKRKNTSALSKLKNLYAFISQVNQNIIRVKDEETLLKNACKMALKFGKFQMAWIGKFDEAQKHITLIYQSGVPDEVILLLTNAQIDVNGPQNKVLHTGTYYICNDMLNEPDLEAWKPFSIKYNIQSCMILPIKLSGKIIGTLDLYSTELNFAQKEEIELLVEATDDISFALDLFEKERQKEFDKNNLEALINNTTDLMWSVDTKFNLITSNKPFDNMVQTMTGGMISKGSNVLSFSVSADQLNRHKRYYERAFAGEAFKEVEYTPLPTEFWSEISYSPIRKGNEVIGTACHSRNITEGKVAMQKLIKSEAFNTGILNSLNAHIAVIDHSGNVIAVNESWKQFSIENGVTNLQRTGVGTNYFDVCQTSANNGSTYASETLTGIKDVMNDKTEVFYFEYPCHSPDEQRWFGMRVLKFSTDDELLVISNQNITDSKLAEIERTKIVNDLMGRNNDLEQFAYIVSHNLRAPVVNIIGATNGLKDPEIDISDKKTFINGIEESVNKLDNVIKDLNQILEVKSAVNQIKEVVFFTELVEDIKASIANLIEENDIEINFNFSEIDQLITLKPYIYSVFYNLISNSIKYRRPEIKTVIEIDSHILDDKVQLVFCDNGLGIDMKKYGKQVFGLYRRFNTQIDGKGMGLFMVKTQVENLGGRIRIKSEPNKGTMFVITF